MFFKHFLFVAESAILLAMAPDHYVATASHWGTPQFCPCQSLGRWHSGCGQELYHLLSILLPHTQTYIVEETSFPSLLWTHGHCQTGMWCYQHQHYLWRVALLSTSFYIGLIFMSYTTFLCTVFQIPSWAARFKTLNTCGSHIYVILMSCIPEFFSFFAYCFEGKIIPHQIHIQGATLCVVLLPLLSPIILG